MLDDSKPFGKGAVMCISIVNRLKGDQIETPKELLKLFELRPLKIIIQVNYNDS